VTGCATPSAERLAPEGAPPIAPAKNVVFIHGMFMTPACWEQWLRPFEDAGFAVHTPAWPLHDAPVSAQRQRHPDATLAALTLADVLAHYRGVVDRLPEKPIVVGHSMGGLIAQLLLLEGRAAAAVAIDSAPPQGVISLRWSFLRSNWGAISPFADDHEPLAMSAEQFAYAFANAQGEEAQRALYDVYYVPESRRVGQGPDTDVAAINGAQSRPPLLLIAGQEDHIIPASLNHDNFEEYADADAVTEFRMFEGRDHSLIVSAGHEEISAFVLQWLRDNAR
jgi:pimeloyl-ACP methyl ester carboxylesterase